ncbi:MAG: YkgJ family cysteine cluster protein [Clostridia bacterium]|nr:YkgJ family cysteine cluster protein [Clostridia bacterium]
MNIQKGLALMNEEASIIEKLQVVYEEVPSGHCEGCLKCCTESVNTFFVEYVNILRFLTDYPQIIEAHAEKISRFFLLEMMESMYCPFVDDRGRCAIYPVRPLPCRVFGHLNVEDYQDNYEKVLASNEALAEYYQTTYGLTLPEEVVHRKIPHCKSFISDGGLTIDDRDDMVDLLFSLDSKFLMHGCITFEEVNQSLITWFIKQVMPLEEAGDLRIQAMQSKQSGDERGLESLIEKATYKINNCFANLCKR